MIDIAAAEAKLRLALELRARLSAAMAGCREAVQKVITAYEIQMIEYADLLADGDVSTADLRLEIEQARSNKDRGTEP